MTKRGLVLVVGATGSGKSTSLAAMIDHRNRTSSGHIITVEDPVEYVHQSQKSLVTHREDHPGAVGRAQCGQQLAFGECAFSGPRRASKAR